MTTTLLVLAALAGALVLLDRLLLAAEARGWVYYRRWRRHGRRVSGAVAGELGAMFSSAERARHEVVIAQEHVPEWREIAGGGPPGV